MNKDFDFIINNEMRVLHVLYQSLPDVAGSSIRSRDIMDSQFHAGICPIAITSPFQEPAKKGEKEEIIKDIKYYRTYSGKENEKVTEKRSSVSVQIKKFLRLFTFVTTTIRVAKKENVDIIHAHATFFCGIAGVLTSTLTHKPCVYEIRSIWFERLKNRKIIFQIICFLEKFAAKHSDYIIAINEKLRNDISTRFSIKKDRIVIVNNAVNLTLIPKELKSPSNKKHEEIVFGYVGNFNEHENIDLLIDCFDELRKLGYDNKLILVGDGILYSSVKKIIQGKNLTNIDLIGKVKPDEIPQYYEKIDIIIIPRKRNKITETVTPLKPLEALAYKKIVMVSNISGIRDLIEEPHVLFFEPTKEDIIEAIKNMINSYNKHVSKVEKSYEYIVNNRSWQKNVEIYKALYINLLKKSK